MFLFLFLSADFSMGNYEDIKTMLIPDFLLSNEF